MEQCFAAIFEDRRHERSLVLLLGLVEPDILKHSEFTDHEISIKKDQALKKLHRRRVSRKKVDFALRESELELYFLPNK